MKSRKTNLRICLLVPMLGLFIVAPVRGQAPPQGTWYFAVSGDSRDCGDLIMPKIARSIELSRARTPVEFYWHLGDLRRMFDIDCDMLLRQHPTFDCKTRKDSLGLHDMEHYLNTAWEDFVQYQIRPFNGTPFYLGIGNHELYANRTRDDFRRAFQEWLTQEPLHAQRMADSSRGISTNEGETYYHFVRKGLDFIYLDKADGSGFTPAEILWLSRILAVDAKDDGIKSIVVGMHAALPSSKTSDHAMDASCQGRCSGQQVYDLLFRAQNSLRPLEERKHVYVFASHSHLFLDNVYDTPEHQGQVLPGWVVGTGGAEQYSEEIRYGYLLVEVNSEGVLNAQFKEVGADSPPLPTGPEANALTRFCFAENKRASLPDDALKAPCACGAAK